MKGAKICWEKYAPRPARANSAVFFPFYHFFPLPHTLLVFYPPLPLSTSPPTTFFPFLALVFLPLPTSARHFPFPPPPPPPPLSPTSPNLGFSTAYRLPHVSPSRRGAFVSRERSPPQRRRHTWPQSVRLSVVLSAGVWGRGPARRLLLGWHTVTCCLVGGNFQWGAAWGSKQTALTRQLSKGQGGIAGRRQSKNHEGIEQTTQQTRNKI